MPDKRPPSSSQHNIAFLLDALETAMRSLWASRQRALLTALGIITGCMAFTASSGVMWGKMNYDLRDWRRMGAEFVSISGPGVLRAAHGQELADQTPGIVSYSPAYVLSTTVRTRVTSMDVKAAGTSAAVRDIVDLRVTAGRFFNLREEETAANVCVVGPTVARTLKLKVSGTETPTVTLLGQPFRVVGVMDSRKGNFPGGGPFDEVTIVPQNVLRELEPNAPLSLLLFKVRSERDVKPAAAALRYRLRRMLALAPLDRDTFEVIQAADIIERIEREYRVGGAVLLTVVCLTLVVGGIGVMNIMLVTVVERTPEIGLRKAVGARAKEILMQFLVESLCLCTLGGVLGTGAGVALAYAAIGVVAPTGEPAIDAALILESIGFAVATGVFFGITPALRASRLSPLEALRRG